MYNINLNIDGRTNFYLLLLVATRKGSEIGADILYSPAAGFDINFPGQSPNQIRKLHAVSIRIMEYNILFYPPASQ